MTNKKNNKNHPTQENINFDTYEEFKKFALERGYEKQMRFGSVEAWYTDGMKAIVHLPVDRTSFTHDVPVEVQFITARSYVKATLLGGAGS